MWSKVGTFPGSGTAEPAYVRPADWLPLPTVNPGDQKFVGLYAVYPDGNYVALSANISSGTFTVDWGDGTSNSGGGSGIQVNHVYDYNSIPSNTTTSKGYRQVIVTITPTTSTFTNIVLDKKHPSITASYVNNGWLDIRMAGSYTGLAFSTSGYVTRNPLLEQFEFIGPSSITNLNYTFQFCYALQNIIIPGPEWSANVTSMTSMFNGCLSLKTVPMMDTSKVLNMGSMFFGCYKLKSVPEFNVSKVTDFSSMFCAIIDRR